MSYGVQGMARAEREAFADLLAGLTPAQWDAPTLCDGWTVRDVAAHTVAYLGQTLPRLILNMTASRGNVDRLNARGLEPLAGLEPERLTALMRDGAAPSGAGALYGARVALIECLIHQQDIRRPLGLPRLVPAERLSAALTYARVSPVIGGARRTRGLRLVATDLDWAAGRGPEIRGSGEALLMAMTGRSVAVADDLTGEGMARLSARARRPRAS
ncbi:maleylpyruvate isomerase family mycothiol-dependent enzyme [Mycobacterium sp. NPDC003449]